MNLFGKELRNPHSCIESIRSYIMYQIVLVEAVVYEPFCMSNQPTIRKLAQRILIIFTNGCSDTVESVPVLLCINDLVKFCHYPVVHIAVHTPCFQISL